MIAALVLAAGQSRRMGTQKLLLSFANQTVIGHVLDQVSQSQCEQVFVVVRPDSPLYSVMSEKNVSVLENPDEQGDMLSSVRVGLKNVPDDCNAVLITPGDFPLIQTAVINQMIHVFQETNQIIVPVYKNKRGHPLLVPRRYFEEILNSYDGIGLRGLLQSRAEDVYELEVADSGVLQDMDVATDYQQVLEQWARKK